MDVASVFECGFSRLAGRDGKVVVLGRRDDSEYRAQYLKSFALSLV